MIRNKRIHFRELTSEIQTLLGDLPFGFLQYFTVKFPKLMVVLYVFSATYLSHELNISPAFSLVN